MVGASLAVMAAPFHALAQQPVAPPAPAQGQGQGQGGVAQGAQGGNAQGNAGQPTTPPPAGNGAMLPAPPPAQPVIRSPVPLLASPAGPASIADLAEGLLDAVVNISTSQAVKGEEGNGPQPQIQQGSPFQEFFDDFFNDKKNQQSAQKVSSLGSGFVIDPSGYVVTNNHVIEGADDIEVIFPSGRKLKAKLVGTDTKTDLSVLKVESKTPLKAVPFGDSKKMRIGDWVMAIGNPFGLGGSVTLGIISARGRNINAGPYDNFIQTDAAINKGNSGGPLFNMRGEVIGINTAIISPSGGSIGIGFAVPTELAENVVHQLIEYGETRRGWLGVRIQPVTDDIASSLGLDKARGALVSGVVADGPIKSGEIKAGDVVLSFDGQAIKEMRDLPRIVAESPVGKQVDVLVQRDGKQQTVKVTLGRLEDSADTDDNDDGDDNGQQTPDGNGGGNSAPGNKQGQNDQQKDDQKAAREPVTLFGMTVAPLDAEQRKTFSIADSVDGVIITAVAQGSAAADKGLKPGDVVVEVAQDFVETPGDVTERFDALKADGRRNAQLMIADKAGNLRFVAISLE
jgi:serine protease Do